LTETNLATWWESKLSRRLDFVAVVAAIVVVCRVALEEDVSWVAWALAFVSVVLLSLTRWPYGALFVLIGMSVMPRFFVQVFGWKARPEHFAVAIMSTIVGVWLLRHKREMRFEKLDYWVLAYVAINYLSSAFGSSSPSATLRWALMNNLAVLPYFLIRLLVRDLATLEKTFRILLGVGIAESAYGILCYISQHLFATTVGMEIGQYLVDVAAPYGSLYEPNLFGAYTACCTVVFLALYLIEGRHPFGYLVCILVASLATVLSFSRGALLALVVAIGWVFWCARRRQNARRGTLTTLLPALAFILIIAAGVMGGVLQERIANLFQQGVTEETTLTRLLVIQESLQDVPNHLLLGTGTASLQLSFDWAKYVPEWADQATWVGNVGVRILHDTGLLGLTVFLCFLVSLCLKIRTKLHGQVPMLVGLSAGGLLYGISFQSTDGTILAFCWIHLGLLASAAVLVNRGVGDSGVIGHVQRRAAQA
jgi:O-Antigen ligase